jgi:hypothetical protein
VIYVFCGSDTFTLHEALVELKAGLNSDGMLATNTTTFEGNQLRPDELLAVCNTTPFMSAHRLVLVEDLDRYRGAAADGAGPVDGAHHTGAQFVDQGCMFWPGQAVRSHAERR